MPRRRPERPHRVHRHRPPGRDGRGARVRRARRRVPRAGAPHRADRGRDGEDRRRHRRPAAPHDRRDRRRSGGGARVDCVPGSRTAATWTRVSSARAPCCTCPSPTRARCSPPATCTPPWATARSAAPASRSRVRSRCGSTSGATCGSRSRCSRRRTSSSPSPRRRRSTPPPKPPRGTWRRFSRSASGMSLEVATMLMSAGGDLQVSQIVDPLRTARFALPKAIIAGLGDELL